MLWLGTREHAVYRSNKEFVLVTSIDPRRLIRGLILHKSFSKVLWRVVGRIIIYGVFLSFCILSGAAAPVGGALRVFSYCIEHRDLWAIGSCLDGVAERAAKALGPAVRCLDAEQETYCGKAIFAHFFVPSSSS